MYLVSAKCTNCGALVHVDPEKDAEICEYCGKPFVVKKAMDRFNYIESSDRTGYLDSEDSQEFESDTESSSSELYAGSHDTRSGFFIGDIVITSEQAARIEDYIQTNQKVKAIKEVRDITGAGLRECKDFVEHHITGFWPEGPSIVNPATASSSNSEKSGGCYVATAVYGSYDCPEVWTLRRFRDRYLAASLPGRAFIRTYYAVSPMIVRSFGRSRWFTFVNKKILDIWVGHLQQKGYESTPYRDMND